MNGVVTEDETCLRIRLAIETDLRQVAKSNDGWETFYQDQGDGRYWALSYPQSQMHGGGPPLLRLVDVDKISVGSEVKR